MYNHEIHITAKKYLTSFDLFFVVFSTALSNAHSTFVDEIGFSVVNLEICGALDFIVKDKNTLLYFLRWLSSASFFGILL